VSREEVGAARAYIAEAASLLRIAETHESCAWCRQHVESVRSLVQELDHVAQMGDDIKRHEALGRLAVHIGQSGETLGVLSLIARFLHRIRGLAR
jgi:hypothetical protein